MKVTILSGSTRTGRQSHKLAYYLKKKLEERVVQTNLIDLAETPLPIFGENANEHIAVKERIKEISNRLQQADGLILVTPEYHGSFSAVLKNSLDHFWSEFQKKPIAVAAASSGRMGGINASVQLQHVILSLGAYPLPLKLLVPEIQKVFDSDFSPLQNSVNMSADKFLDEFLWFTESISDKKKEETKISQA
jgi:NAD(P)H-dependent FMN reductase